MLFFCHNSPFLSSLDDDSHFDPFFVNPTLRLDPLPTLKVVNWHGWVLDPGERP